MSDQILHLKPRTREAAIVDAVPEGEGVLRLELSFASEAPVERFDMEPYLEILDCSTPGAMLAERINSGAPLLFNHSWDAHIGTVEKAWVDPASRTARAVVRFGDNDLALQKARDVRSGILQKVSFMYAVHALVPEPTGKGEPRAFRATQWEPYEVSLVTVPADYTVGVENSRHAVPVACRVAGIARPDSPTTARSVTTQEGGRMAESKATEQVEVQALEKRCAEMEKQIAESKGASETLARFYKFTGIARNLGALDLGVQAAVENWSDEKFGEEIAKRTKASTTPENYLDLTPRDTQRFSVIKLIRSLISGRRDDAAFEWECSAQIGKRWNKEPENLRVTRAAFLPFDIQSRVLPVDARRRDITVGSLTGGGYTVQTQYGSFIEMLRHNTALLPFVTMLNGLVGELKIARQTSAGQAYWIGDGADPTESTQGFGMITMTRKKLGAFTDIDESMLSQSSIDAEQFVINDLSRVMGLKLDSAIINGVGAAGEPLGVLNHSGIGSVTTSGGITHAESVEFITDIINSDYPANNLHYWTNGTIMGTAMTTLRDAVAGAGYVWEGGVNDGRINGYPAHVSTNMPASTMICGDPAAILVGRWGDLQIGVDLSANFLSGGARVRLLDGADVALRHTGAISAATDI